MARDSMSDVTRILSQLEQGDPQAAEKLLPLVYDDLRKLAAVKLAQEKPGQTLQATALVHDAYVRLVEGPTSQSWESRRHFFAAAAEAMRRILVEQARRKSREKHGGHLEHSDKDLELIAGAETADPLVVLAVHESLERLAARSPRKAELVKLRYFLGYTVAEAAEILGIAAATAEEDWTYARAWLRREWLRGQATTAPFKK
jgi:RNA polymerase sigma factor (TIGR02999 family)